jgi:hypothetical protein
MRYYTIKPKNGDVKFTCTFCDYNVSTSDFDRSNGHLRTQAAADINKHAGALHSRGKSWPVVPPVKLAAGSALGYASSLGQLRYSSPRITAVETSKALLNGFKPVVATR